MAAEQVYVQGEGGGVFLMDKPFQKHVQQRFDRGELRIVDGSGGDGEDAPAPRRRTPAKPKQQ